MHKITRAIVVAVLGVGMTWPQFGIAAERNDIPSCYTWAKLEAQRPALSGRELVIIVDQTVYVPESLQRSAWAHVMRYLRPGDTVRLYQFSALLVDHHLGLSFAGQLETPLEGKLRNRIGSDDLKKLDGCLKQQMGYFHQSFGKIFAGSFFATENSKVVYTELLSSLQKIGDDMVARPVDDRVVLLISDMLENSKTTSFYGAGKIRDIDPQAELKKASPFVTNFAGARFYVHGAGVVGGYLPGETLSRLEQFWRAYLTQSNASLQGFGTPELTMDLR